MDSKMMELSKELLLKFIETRRFTLNPHLRAFRYKLMDCGPNASFNEDYLFLQTFFLELHCKFYGVNIKKLNARGCPYYKITLKDYQLLPLGDWLL